MEWDCLLRVFSGRDPSPQRVRVPFIMARMRSCVKALDWNTSGVSQPSPLPRIPRRLLLVHLQVRTVW